MSEDGYGDRMMNLLRSDELRRSIQARLNEIRVRVLGDKAFSDEDADDVLSVDLDFMTSETFGDIFTRRFFGKLSEPHRVTMDDLIETMRHQLGGSTACTFVEAYKRFLTYVCDGQVEHEHREWFDLGEWAGGELEIEPMGPLWISESGFVLHYVRQDCPAGGWIRLSGFLRVTASPRAFEEAQRAVQSPSLAAIRCLRSVAEARCPPTFWRLPVETLLSERSHGYLISFMSAYFCSNYEDEQGDKEFRFRLKNATRLLVHADAQEHAAIRLSLCFAAMEALICGKRTPNDDGDGIAAQLARRIPTLLNCPKRRVLDAQKGIRLLYNKRSRLLHGDQIDEEDAAADQTHRLASAVLFAIGDWQKCSRRAGSSPTWNEFLGELATGAELKQEMVGVSDDLWCCLPGLSNVRDTT